MISSADLSGIGEPEAANVSLSQPTIVGPPPIPIKVKQNSMKADAKARILSLIHI